VLQRSADQPRVAIVLPGGGARGAYEAGALSVLLAELEVRGERVSIYCGTSVGAINAAALASHAHRPPGEQAQLLLETWKAVGKEDVTGRILGPNLAVGLASYAGEVLGLPGVRFRGLVDAAPLRRNLKAWIDWDSLHRNASAGIAAVCAVATSLRSGVSVGFVEAPGADAPRGGAEEIDYRRVELTEAHVRASAAIPAIFSPVRVDESGSVPEYFIDGGTRLNAPIRPGIDLGADRIIVVSFEPYVGFASSPLGSRRPGFADIAANVLDGLLADQVVADIRRLAAINSFFAEDIERSSQAARAYRQARGRRPYRRIPYALVAPSRRRQLGSLAEAVFARRYGGLKGLRDLDLSLMAQVLGGGPSRGELLTFLFFDPEFIAAMIAAGKRDARRWLRRHPNFWCSEASHDLDLDATPTLRDQEVTTLAEWRSLRRR
jgi:NTE family protein